jgi:hypothetical protein
VGQAVGAGNHAGLSALAGDKEDRLTVLEANHPGRETQGLGDPKARLIKKKDQKLIPSFMPFTYRCDHPLYFFPGQIGSDAECFSEGVVSGDKGFALSLSGQKLSMSNYTLMWGKEINGFSGKASWTLRITLDISAFSVQ